MVKEKKKFWRDRWFYFVIIVCVGGGLLLGTVAYNGMVTASKIGDTKRNYSQAVKYIAAELQKCSLGETTAMDGGLTCSNYTATKAIKVAASKLMDKNPYKYSDLAVRVSNSNTNNEDVGYISLSTSGSNIIIKSCNKTPCNEKANRQSSTVSIK